jgi:hypothetical protein
MSTESSSLTAAAVLIDAGLMIVMKYLRDGETLPLTAVCLRLLSEHPACQMSFEEIKRYLIRTVVDHHVGVRLSDEAGFLD